MQIYNTLTKEKEEFKPFKQDTTKVYYCGPTPYNYAHIGNLKTYVGNDVIVRTLRFLGYPVKTTMNITDIDDKTIRDSQKAGKNLLEYTHYYSDAFFEDLEKLDIVPADHIAPISDLIPEMVRMINTLLRRGHAYISDDGSVYFNIKTYKKYGELAHLNMEGMKDSVRIDNDEYEKDNVGDFALWKAWIKEDGDNFWEGDFEVDKNIKTLKGRPGWHIECSACAMKFLGPQIDLHMGGIDNLFPHHQNEAAQTECCTRKTFSKYWSHHGHLTVDGAKMSKSKNNFYTLKDVESKFGDIDKKLIHRAVRLNFINGKYRDSIDFSFDKIEANLNTLKGIDETLKNIRNYTPEIEGVSKEFSDYMQDTIQSFYDCLEDDFSLPEALATMFQFQKFVNSNLKEGLLAVEEKEAVIDMYKTFNQIFAIIDFSVLDEAELEVPAEIQKKFEARNIAKAEKDFELADSLRDEMLTLGYKIIDEKQGSRVEKV